ncbi:DUF1376 domain-containing protein [Hymenobacter sp. BT594]|uniref:DUF1376 domain-containing protein n=1 Tax=Hymenobacter guriensis TaxID=2793065 RepID=A0ABS0KWU0_9BACT|nr:DUF1376 domain-containing protein [Hymenobacter guriensis]
MKSPAFQWYAADYLADERVTLLSLEAEGAYVRLLSYCWREGSIPANPALLSAMCKYADVKVIKAALALFTKVGAPSGRLIHKRLEEERGKQEAFREKQIENGKRGGRPRKDLGNPNETQTKGLGFFGETQTEPKKTSTTSTSSTTTSSTSEEINTPSSLRSEVVAPAKVEEVEYSSHTKSTGGPEKLPPEDPGASASHTRGARRPKQPKQEPAHFAAFYDAYPRKENRQAAAAAFARLSEADQLEAIASVKAWFARKADWLGPQGEDYRPHPSTWLNNTRWKELTNPTTPSPQAHAIPRSSTYQNPYGAAARLHTPAPDPVAGWGYPGS